MAAKQIRIKVIPVLLSSLKECNARSARLRRLRPTEFTARRAGR
jgi:hypothetical protein